MQKNADASHRRIGKGECCKITLFLNYRRDNQIQAFRQSRLQYPRRQGRLHRLAV